MSAMFTLIGMSFVSYKVSKYTVYFFLALYRAVKAASLEVDADENI